MLLLLTMVVLLLRRCCLLLTTLLKGSLRVLVIVISLAIGVKRVCDFVCQAVSMLHS